MVELVKFHTMNKISIKIAMRVKDNLMTVSIIFNLVVTQTSALKTNGSFCILMSSLAEIFRHLS